MAGLHSSTKFYLGLIAFSILGTLASHFLRADAGPIPVVAAIATIGLGCWAVGRWVRWPALIGVLVLGIAAEVCGIYTGLPFGRYEYTQAWIPVIGLPAGKIFPLQLPFAWLLIAGGCSVALGNRLGRASFVFAGLAAALIDLVMEPVMVARLGYWKWLEPGPLPGGAPVLNFIGWWLVSAVAALLLARKRGDEPKGESDAAAVLVGYLALMAVVYLFPAIKA